MGPASEDADGKGVLSPREKLTAAQIEALEAQIAALKEENIVATGEDFKTGLNHADCQKRFQINGPQHRVPNGSVSTGRSYGCSGSSGRAQPKVLPFFRQSTG
jgi:hypothetical protein